MLLWKTKSTICKYGKKPFKTFDRCDSNSIVAIVWIHSTSNLIYIFSPTIYKGSQLKAILLNIFIICNSILYFIHIFFRKCIKLHPLHLHPPIWWIDHPQAQEPHLKFHITTCVFPRHLTMEELRYCSKIEFAYKLCLPISLTDSYKRIFHIMDHQ